MQITSTVTTEEPNIEKFWSVEAIGMNIHRPSTDSSFLQSYQQTSITQTPEGYIARFLWKEDKPLLPSNINTCKRGTQTLLNKLRQTPELLCIYDHIIKEQEEQGFIERVYDGTTQNVHYLPHHPVKKESATTPIRIMYDCNCRGHGNLISLNDCLIIGLLPLNNLCPILIQFRTFSADIEKAFLHVKLHPTVRNYTRFLWPTNPTDPTSEFQPYRFTVVPFGSSSSPFMLGAVLDLLLSKLQSKIATENMYVDNILLGSNTEEDLIMYYEQA